MSGKKKILLALIIILLVLTGGVYGYGVHYFTGHFFPGSMVNGYNCSYMSVEETEALMNREAAAYALAIDYEGNGREAVTAAQVGLRYSSDGTVSRMMHDQNRFAWFLEFNREHPHDLSRSLSYEEEMMDSVVSNLKCADPARAVPPQDAGVTMKSDGTFAITPEVPGSTLDMEKTRAAISQAMLAEKPGLNLIEEGCYLRPSVTADDPVLASNCDRMNQLVNVIITLDFGRTTERVDHDVIMTWFGYDEGGYVILDPVLVRAYVSGLAEKYDSVGTEKSFRTYDGRNITVSGGDFGWVLDIEGETADLIAAVESGETQVRQPVYFKSGFERGSNNEIGFTYVEIDVSRQKLVYYENGVPLIETDCVTGSGTPGGVWCAGSPDMFRELTGGFARFYNPEAFTPEARTDDLSISSVRMDSGLITGATVTYWMPFDGVCICEGVARNIYGLDGYYREPTTGNVEIAPTEAAALFGRFVPNLPVVVY